MDDNRPIKPDPKYIEQYLHRINTVQAKPFLKKKSNPTLPCYAFKNIQSHSQSKQQKTVVGKTKAQVYEEIKRKNKEMFGQKKPGQLQLQEKQKKIHPKKMTVDYKPKKTIQIEQYKKKDYAPNKNKQTNTQNKDKIQYQKLLDYFNKQLKSLEQQKKQFHQVAEKLKFKQSIQNQQPLIYSQVKSQVRKKLAKAEEQEKTLKCHKNSHTQQLPKQQNKQSQQILSKTYSVQDIKSKLEKTSQQMQLLKSELVSPSLQVKQHRYQIFQAHLLPTFDPQTIYDYIDPNKLKFNANKYYQSALKAFNCKFEKENKQCENVQEDQQCRSRPNIKEKFIGEKRVTKYDEWTEVWIPGKQRLMANKDNYKVIWLSNGDVTQDFGNNIKTYYSKAKDIYKIQYKNLPPVYYHQNTQQIWRYLENYSREIVFPNGRLQIINKMQE